MAGESDFSEIEKLERLLLEADVRNSPGQLERILAPDFLEIGRSGQVYDRAQIIAALGRESFSDDRPLLSLSDITFKVIADEIVLVTYRSSRTMGDGVLLSLRSSLWKKSDNVWRIIFHQGTPLAQ